MPLAHGQTDPVLHASLMYEDTLLLRIRIERLAGQRTFSQQPKSRCHHLLQRPQVVDFDANATEHRVRTAFHYTETRGDDLQFYVGWATHHVVVDAEGQLRIRLKRVDLLNCDAPSAIYSCSCKPPRSPITHVAHDLFCFPKHSQTMAL